MRVVIENRFEDVVRVEIEATDKFDMANKIAQSPEMKPLFEYIIAQNGLKNTTEQRFIIACAIMGGRI